MNCKRGFGENRELRTLCCTHRERAFAGRRGNPVIPDQFRSKGPRGKIGAFQSLMRKLDRVLKMAGMSAFTRLAAWV